MGKEKSIGSRLLGNVYVKNIGLMLLASVGLVFAVLWGLNIYTKHGDYVVVPQLKGMQVGDAAGILSNIDLKYEVVDSVFKKGGVPGTILDQIPKDSSKVKEGRTIYLTVQARGEEMIVVPDVIDASQRQAEALLGALGFENISVREIEGEFENLVLGLEYKGAAVKTGQKLPKSASIILKVGKGVSVEGDTLFDFDMGQDTIIDETFE